MKTYLLDANLLVALFWPTHVHHRAAHRWFQARRRSRWATCPLTQLAFVRLTSSPGFSPDALTPHNALELLQRNVQHPDHEFWPDTLPPAGALRPVSERLQGYRQFTDLYLLALAAHTSHGQLATFDGGLEQFAPTTSRTVIEIVPTQASH